MGKLRASGSLEIEGLDTGLFTATRCDDRDILRLIGETRERFGYLADPHTACGFQDLDPEANTIVLATAHPAKFPETIRQATGEHPTHPALEALLDRRPVTYPLDATPEAIRAFILANKA